MRGINEEEYKKGFKEGLAEVDAISEIGDMDEVEELSYYKSRISEELELGDSYSKGYIEALQDRKRELEGNAMVRGVKRYSIGIGLDRLEFKLV